MKTPKSDYLIKSRLKKLTKWIIRLEMTKRTILSFLIGTVLRRTGI